MPEQISVSAKDIMQIKKDIELLKNLFLSENELTEWAKEELAEARKEKEDEYVSLSDL